MDPLPFSLGTLQKAAVKGQPEEAEERIRDLWMYRHHQGGDNVAGGGWESKPKPEVNRESLTGWWLPPEVVQMLGFPSAQGHVPVLPHLAQTVGELSSWLQTLLKTALLPVNWSSASELSTTGWWVCFVRL
ncbi:uncharacterized protein LOC144365463 [Ictidomys tridecemlineatus]